MTKKYAKRDIDDERFEDLRLAHLNAMTAEGLHSKAAIAAELAVRDLEVLKLRDTLKVEREGMHKQLEDIRQAVYGLQCAIDVTG